MAGDLSFRPLRPSVPTTPFDRTDAEARSFTSRESGIRIEASTPTSPGDMKEAELRSGRLRKEGLVEPDERCFLARLRFLRLPKLMKDSMGLTQNKNVGATL